MDEHSFIQKARSNGILAQTLLTPDPLTPINNKLLPLKLKILEFFFLSGTTCWVSLWTNSHFLHEDGGVLTSAGSAVSVCKKEVVLGDKKYQEGGYLEKLKNMGIKFIGLFACFRILKNKNNYVTLRVIFFNFTK